MSLPHPQDCPHCKDKSWNLDEHISNTHGYWAGSKYRFRHNLRRANWFDLTAKILFDSIIIAIAIIVTKGLGVW